eukprot:CAMPEP_0173469098 /NCGR_PEP_ID=MMETSP1357-20121228/77188_1 /TAXON_ID=77926 /ORGANISM="Hemiselmis rufescens, Strain PCC563" /LENGTH=206 /DNA_ID=CAMNT_0014437329 /DNA_START=40 /DNA_END=660 /DNA_ORIENTATION=-
MALLRVQGMVARQLRARTLVLKSTVREMLTVECMRVQASPPSSRDADAVLSNIKSGVGDIMGEGSVIFFSTSRSVRGSNETGVVLHVGMIGLIRDFSGIFNNQMEHTDRKRVECKQDVQHFDEADMQQQQVAAPAVVNCDSEGVVQQQQVAAPAVVNCDSEGVVEGGVHHEDVRSVNCDGEVRMMMENGYGGAGEGIHLEYPHDES